MVRRPRVSTASPAVTALVLVAVAVAVSSVAAQDDDWEEWGETAEKRKVTDTRRMINRGAVPNVPPPPGMDAQEFAQGMADSMTGGVKLFFIKTDEKLVGDVDAGKALAARWSMMINNAGHDISVFPMDNKQTIAQCPPWEIETAKKFFLKQKQVREVVVDSTPFTKADVQFDDTDDTDDDDTSDSDDL